MARKKAPKRLIGESIGECIYCGAKGVELRDEHIIPAGLSGTWTIPKANCDACAEIISLAELKVLRGPLRLPRASLGLFTRNPDKMPKTLPLTVNGELVDLPASDYPGFLTLVEFEPPAYWSGKLRPPGRETVMGSAARVDRGRLEQLARRALGPASGGDVTVSWSVEFSFEELEALRRVLAKIAFCAVVARHGRSAVKSTFLQDVILAKSPFASHFVGTVPADTPLAVLPPAVTRFESSPDPGKNLEYHRVTTARHRGMWHAYVQLFRGFYGAAVPIHHVIVGEAA